MVGGLELIIGMEKVSRVTEVKCWTYCFDVDPAVTHNHSLSSCDRLDSIMHVEGAVQLKTNVGGGQPDNLLVKIHLHMQQIAIIQCQDVQHVCSHNPHEYNNPYRNAQNSLLYDQ